MGSFGDVQDGLAGPVGTIVEGQRLELRVNGLHRRTNGVEQRRCDSIAIVGGQLDHRGGVSTTAANDLEALGTQHRFTGLDRAEAGLGDTSTGVEPTRQAWRGRKIGLDDAEVSGNGANTGLADTGFDERVSHPGLGSGIKAGPVLAQIISIGTAHDHGVGSCDVGMAKRSDRCIQVGLAEVTAVGRIREVALVLELIGTNELECPTAALGVHHDSAGALPGHRRGDGVRDDGCRWRSAVSDRRQQK